MFSWVDEYRYIPKTELVDQLAPPPKGKAVARVSVGKSLNIFTSVMTEDHGAYAIVCEG